MEIFWGRRRKGGVCVEGLMLLFDDDLEGVEAEVVGAWRMKIWNRKKVIWTKEDSQSVDYVRWKLERCEVWKEKMERGV